MTARAGTRGARTMSAAAAAELVKPGDRVVLGSLGAAPTVLLEALSARAAELPNLTVMSGMMLDDYAFLRAGFPDLRYRTWFMPTTLGAVTLPSELVDYLPMSWTQVLRSIEESVVDVAIVQASPPDADGWLSLGTSVSYTLPIVRQAHTVLVQVNEAMPRTCGESLIHESEIDALVEVNRPLVQFPMRPAGEIGRVIAALTAELVPDGVTLQPVIGSLPDAVLAVLARRGADVRLHSIVTDGAIDLVAANAGAGRPAMVGEVVGTDKLYEFVADNPAVQMAPAGRTHTMAALMDIGPFVSVNSALEVDLFGQVNAEYLGGAQAGGVGGSMDFMIAAGQPGNLSVIALPSTTRDGSRSRIRGCLDPGPVSIPRTMTQVIVTEYGVADLRGCSTRERAERLLAVAHPDHRADLLRAWAGPALRPRARSSGRSTGD